MMWPTIRHVCLQRLSVVISLFSARLPAFVFILVALATGVAYAASVERITRYQYDGAGNIVGIATQEQAAPPIVNALDLNFINVGNRAEITATGENLLGADVVTDAEGLTISNVSSLDNQVTFTLTASAQAALGNAPLRFVTGLGEAEQSLIVAQAPPVLITNPNPIVIEGNSVTTTVTLTFIDPRPAQETYTVIITDTDIVTTAQTSFTIGAGQRQATLELTGIGAIGSLTQLEIELAEELRFYSFPVTVSRNFLEILAEYPDIQQSSLFSPRVGVLVSPEADLDRSVYSEPVGVVVSSESNVEQSVYSEPVGIVVSPEPEADLERSVYSGPVGVIVSPEVDLERLAYSDPVRIIVAPLIDNSLQPTVATPNSNIVLEVSGVNLQTVQSVSITPDTGLTLGTLSTNSEGTVLSFPIDIEAAAALGIYKITLTGPQGVVPTSSGLPLSLTIE